MEKTAEEWQGLLQSILLGLIISFLLAYLISLLLTRPEPVSRPPPPTPSSESNQPRSSISLNDAVFDDVISRASEQDSLAAEIGSSVNSIDGGIVDDDDDDWEGVESTELDELFSAATAFVAATAADSRRKVSSDVQLQLYGLYKIATEGPCSSPQPSALKMTARAKWQAWQKMGAMPPEDAMQKYIEIVTELYPDWAAGAVNKSRGDDADSQKLDNRGPMGPVFSTFVYEEESGDQLKMDAIHTFAREGEAEKLLKCLESGILVDSKDSEGRTPLHWAVDRGHFDIMELLVSKNADVNAKDNEGQTPLHYAAMCEREAIAKFLVKHGADGNMKDQDGNSPCDLCNSDSSLMLGASDKQIS